MILSQPFITFGSLLAVLLVPLAAPAPGPLLPRVRLCDDRRVAGKALQRGADDVARQLGREVRLRRGVLDPIALLAHRVQG